jgi:formamidopyrimidine-DNA glycosylase
MPELPEVEHAARTLRRWLAEGPVVRAHAGATRLFRAGDHRTFERALPGRRLDRIERRGKLLLLFFDGDVGLLSHLGMTGRWVRRLPAETPAHSHARLELSGGGVLHYCDPRLFGRLEIHRAAFLPALPAVLALGPDPVADGIDVAALHATLSATRRAVKPAIMDQAVLAGVGNIYATEALFRAGVHPARAASSLSKREVGRIAKGIEASLAEALARPEAEEEEMVYLSQGGPARPNPFLVYDRAGEPCPRCRRALEKATIGGRTSAYCGRCQKAG